MDSFYKQAYEIVGKIPYGKVVSYGQIGWMLGRPGIAPHLKSGKIYFKQRWLMMIGTKQNTNA